MGSLIEKMGKKTRQHTTFGAQRSALCTKEAGGSSDPLFASINVIVYIKRNESSEFKRWLAEQGATFKPGKGSHLRVFLNGKQSVLPMHGKELKKGLVEGIKKQLGLK